jgi:hypothetical protein
MGENDGVVDPQICRMLVGGLFAALLGVACVPGADPTPGKNGSAGDGAHPECPLPSTDLVADDLTDGEESLTFNLPPGLRCHLDFAVDTEMLLEVTVRGGDGALLSFDIDDENHPTGHRPGSVLLPGDHVFSLGPFSNDTSVTATFIDRGPPVEAVDRDRSLVWIQSNILDNSTLIGLSRLMNVVDSLAPGPRWANLLAAFSQTAHSERAGPQLLLEDLQAEFGEDPTQWDLDALPFVITAVHNRLDLAGSDHCGEFRVSLSSTHPIHQPLHFLFLFTQAPLEGDRDPTGALTCLESARQWAHLSTLSEDSFLEAADALLDRHLRPEHFFLVESVEFTVAPWEWRQWRQVENPEPHFENIPLFQQVDAERLNEPGPARDAFLDFVEANAEALNSRTLLIPEAHRPQSVRVNQGVPWIPLDLSGVDPAVLEAHPQLRQNIEIMGCAACHATDADFVQTRTDRTFSDFYDKELDARADVLWLWHQGEKPAIPFGPLQHDPVLPP